MKFNEGKVLNDTLMDAIQIANDVFFHKNGNIDKFANYQLSYHRLDMLYQNFLAELKVNILDYNKTEYIIEYIDICFEKFLKWKGFGPTMSDKLIIRNQHEVGFLLKLKKYVETYHATIHTWYKIDYKHTELRVPLIERYERTITELKKVHNLDELGLFGNRKSQKELQLNIEDIQPFDNHFDFDKLKNECDKQPTLVKKIEFMHQRLIEFRHWKLNQEDG